MPLANDLGLYIKMPLDKNGRQIKINDVVFNGYSRSCVAGVVMVSKEPFVVYLENGLEYDRAKDVEVCDELDSFEKILADAASGNDNHDSLLHRCEIQASKFNNVC